jgi:lipopolysaccharide export system permease protein
MPILTRYVLSEMLKVFLIALAGMTLFFLLIGLVKEAYNEGLGLKQIILLIPYVLPDALRFSVPATILFAACNVFGRLASGNEVVAVKASGISPMVLFWPAIILAFVVSLAAVWLNDIAVSWGYDGIARVVVEAVEEVAYGKLAQQHSYSAHQFSINVGDVVGKRLIRPTISLQGGGDSSQTTIICDEATMHSDLQANTLTLKCYNATIEVGGASGTFPYYESVIPLDDSSRRGSGNKSPAYLPMAIIPTEKVRQLNRIDTLQQQLAANAAFQLITGDFPALEKSTWQNDQRELTDAQQRMYRLDMEPYRRWANGFSCLCFVLVGAPLAIRMRNSDLLTSFFMCFLPILICYYPLLMFGVSKAKSGLFPSWGVWAGNVILAVVGAQFIRRVYQR